MKTKLVVFVLASLGCNAAWSGSVTCSGTVEEITFHASNLFYIRLSSMNTPVAFCNPDANYNAAGSPHATGPETCKAMIAMFIAARETGRQLNSVYFDGDTAPATCNTWAPWSGANIRYYSY
jgi:hypothetical protein